MRQLKLHKYISNTGTKVTPQNCNLEGLEYHYLTENGGVKVQDVSDCSIKAITSRGEYVLKRRPSQNFYLGMCNGYKVHIILRSMTGTVIFWTGGN